MDADQLLKLVAERVQYLDELGKQMPISKAFTVNARLVEARFLLDLLTAAKEKNDPHPVRQNSP